MKKIKQLLHCNPIIEMPPEIKHRKNIVLFSIISSYAFFDFLSFSMKGAQVAISAGLNYLSFFFLVLYFIKNVLQDSVYTFIDAQMGLYNEAKNEYITDQISSVSNAVRRKVKEQKNGYSRIMQNSEIIHVLNEFIKYVWDFIFQIPEAISNIIIAVVMFFGIIITEFYQTKNIKITIALSILVILCIGIFSYLSKIRFKIRKKYRELLRILRKENARLFNDVENIEPLIPEEFEFRKKYLIANGRERLKTEKTQIFKLNTVKILKSAILALFIFGILGIKIYFVGGIKNLNLEVILDILSIVTVYSTIMNKVSSIIQYFEDIATLVRDVENVKPDFDNIMRVYQNELTRNNVTNTTIDKIVVNEFSFSYQGSTSVYKLENTVPFTLYAGNSYLVHGQTGCGKTTFMHILTGQLKLDKSPISHGENCERAYLSSIMQENEKIGSFSILEEILFSSDTKCLDRQKLIEILKGTHIYFDIMRNLGLSECDDEKIIKYLSQSTIEQYSAGQKQRLSIVKVLYNMSSVHQIIVFDEATNALDNKTADSVLRFMAEYCQKDRKRIVLFVSHQVEITEKIVQGTIGFDMINFPTFTIKVIQ